MQVKSLPTIFTTSPMASTPSTFLTPPNSGVSTPSPSSPEANASIANANNTNSASANKVEAHPFATMLKKSQVAEPSNLNLAAETSKVNPTTTEPVSPADEPQALANTTKLASTSRTKRLETMPIKVEHPSETPKAGSDKDEAVKDSKDARDQRDVKDATGLLQAPEPAPRMIELGLASSAKRAGSAVDQSKAGAGIDGDAAKAQAGAGGGDVRTPTSQVELSVRGAPDKLDAASAASRNALRADASGDKLDAVKHVALDDRTSHLDAPTSAPASFASTLAQLTGGSAAAAPVDVAVATPMNAPEFAQALGAQVSMLVAGGVQRAELHLNPGEMGPVSIEITLNGTQAQVDFGADLATTRHAIEAGLPELASALQDAGFTLHGGGVSQHSAKQSDAGQDRGESSWRGGGARSTSMIGADASTAALPAARQRITMTGGVDVYA